MSTSTYSTPCRLGIVSYSILVTLFICSTNSNQQDASSLKTEPFYLDLYHKFDLNEAFKLRGSILVRPRSEHRLAQATFVQQQSELTDQDLNALQRPGADSYYLKAELRRRKADKADKPSKVTQTIVKSCSLATSNLVDYITVNLNPTNEFISVNLHTDDPECRGPLPSELARQFNTTLSIYPGTVGPLPDTATYIKRLEEERQSKLKEGKEDNRSFFAKYWIYIVPAVVILMMFSGPDQGAR